MLKALPVFPTKTNTVISLYPSSIIIDPGVISYMVHTAHPNLYYVVIVLIEKMADTAR